MLDFSVTEMYSTLTIYPHRRWTSTNLKLRFFGDGLFLCSTFWFARSTNLAQLTFISRRWYLQALQTGGFLNRKLFVPGATGTVDKLCYATHLYGWNPRLIMNLHLGIHVGCPKMDGFEYPTAAGFRSCDPVDRRGMFNPTKIHQACGHKYFHLESDLELAIWSFHGHGHHQVVYQLLNQLIRAATVGSCQVSPELSELKDYLNGCGFEAGICGQGWPFPGRYLHGK